MVTAKYLNEVIGTFFLVFTISMVSGSFAPVAIAAILAAFIYAGGHSSGGHYNPAVSLGMWLRGALSSEDLIPYMLAQTIGAIAAAGVYLYGMNPAVAQLPVLVPNLVIPAEFLYTFALVFVVLNTATIKTTQSNSFFGIAIALTVLAGAYAVGGISSAVFNPAVAVGLVVMKKMSLATIWMYLVATFGGSIAAAYAFKAVNKNGSARL